MNSIDWIEPSCMLKPGKAFQCYNWAIWGLSWHVQCFYALQYSLSKHLFRWGSFFMYRRSLRVSEMNCYQAMSGFFHWEELARMMYMYTRICCTAKFKFDYRNVYHVLKGNYVFHIFKCQIFLHDRHQSCLVGRSCQFTIKNSMIW